VNAILGRLTRAGVVLAERQGNAVLYRANRDHVGGAVVDALAGMRRSALDAMRAEIAGWQTAPVTALCFGSFARGEGDEYSDVDLLLVRPSDVAEFDDTWDRQQQALRVLVQTATGNWCTISQSLTVGFSQSTSQTRDGPRRSRCGARPVRRR
jgi:predicted nucleotidyltransferase